MRRTKSSITARYKVKALVLTTIGRKSGRQRHVVLQYFTEGDSMIVVATNDGGATHPAWYLNSARKELSRSRSTADVLT
jgi:deazaflavin-dependent oxidoreductase (nitroreductase family)